jgi:periplasmic divalent cation tolerance protein
MSAGKVSADGHGMLLTTLPTVEEARRIAKLLVDERLAACVQLSAIESFYRWDGGVANEPETLLRIKTRTALFDKAISRLKEIHPYTVPQIVGTAFQAGHPDYFAWIDDST